MPALSLDRNRLERIAIWMADHVAAGRLAGLDVQICQHQQICFSRQHGPADIEAGRPVATDTVWRIYSMTKPITSLAALMLYESGAFQLDQPVADFIPDFARLRVWEGGNAPLSQTMPLARPVTIHDLMTHQSGLIYGFLSNNKLGRAYAHNGLNLDRHGDIMANAVTRLCDLPLLFQPGTRWFYGLSTDVLGHLVEIISGLTLGAFMDQHIFQPLGMNDTGFALKSDHPPRLAALYGPTPERNGLIRLETAQSPFVPPVTLESGGGGLISTMADYQRFATMMLNRGAYSGGRLLGSQTFAMMVANQMGTDLAGRGQPHFAETTMEGIGFGLGVAVTLDPVRAKILGSRGEFSWGGLASTTFWVDPQQDLTAILMTQLSPSSTYTLRRQLRVLTYQALID